MVLPLTFVSSAFVPTASMPGIVQTFAETFRTQYPADPQTFADTNPVTVAVDAARALTVGHGDALGSVLGTVAWLAALLLVFVPLAVRAFRR